MTTHPTLADGRYVVKRCVGRGGMGAVFLAQDEVLKGPRAIKVLEPSLMTRPEARARFRTEAIAMSQLNHPHIIRVFDQGEEGLTSYIVMEYVAHGSLRGLLQRAGVLERDLAISMCLDIADGLHHAHARGIIHRDIKPDNILLGEAGAKLTDFGIARLWDQGSGLTRSRAALGTPAFMPPEQRLDSKRCTARADLYALGATLFVLLTADDPIDLYEPDAREHLLEGIDAPLAEVIRTAVQSDPEARFASAQSMKEALEAVRETPGAPRTRPGPTQGHTTAEPPDLHELHRLWRSYVTPMDASGNAMTMGMTFADSTMDGAQAGDLHEVASESVQPSSSSSQSTGPDTVMEVTATDSVARSTNTPEPAPARPRVWPMVLTLVVGIGIGGLAIWTTQDPPVASPTPPATAVETVAEPIALEALLAADPEGAANKIRRGNGTDNQLVRSMLHSLADAPAAAAEAMAQAAAAPPTGNKALAQAIQLSHATMQGTEDAAVLAARWETLTTKHTDAAIQMLHVLSAHGRLGPAHTRTAVKRAMALHPQTPLFDWLNVRLHDSPPASAERAARLDEALARHPAAPALIAERVRLLMWQGKLEAAAETLRRLETVAPRSSERLLLAANLHAWNGNEADRTAAWLSLGDDLRFTRRQQHFLREHGAILASVGRLKDARMTWDYAVREAVEPQLEDEAVYTLLRSLETSILLGVAPEPEASFDAIQARLEGVGRSEAWMNEQRARLLFFDGLQATRSSDPVLATKRLEQLEALPTSTGSAGTNAIFAEQLSLEIKLVSAGDSDRLMAEARSGSVAASSTCAWLGLRGRIAARANKPTVLVEAAEKLQDGLCQGDPAQRELLSLQTASLVAKMAASDDAPPTLHSRRARWLGADEDLPLRAQILALTEP